MNRQSPKLRDEITKDASSFAITASRLHRTSSAAVNPAISAQLPFDIIGTPLPQTFRNGEIHDWYRIILGYSDHLVADLIKKFGLAPGANVIDPFSGSGTTAVECKKSGIDCWAVDANPSSCFAARVKVNWGLSQGALVRYAFAVAEVFESIRSRTAVLRTDKTAAYLFTSGMIDRAWISTRRLFDVLAIKTAIRKLDPPANIRDALTLATVHVLLHTASNVRFGPELYCGRPRKGVRIIDSFLVRVLQMVDDLGATASCSPGKAKILKGDSRKLRTRWVRPPVKGFDAVITSPPYPTEHDYTRNSRLELAFLEAVTDRESLRSIKRGMVRSHTKGIYIKDSAEDELTDFPRILRLAKRIDKKARGKKYGFARLYGKVTREYFGGMRQHFRSIFPLLRPGAHCAYVVGDQSSYFRIKIPTAKLLADIAVSEGFKLEGIDLWRERWSTSTKKFIKENILLLRKPRKRKPRKSVREKQTG